MLRGRRDLNSFVGALVMATVVAGCSAQSSSDHDGHDGESVLTINGEIPPNKPTPLTESTVVVDVVEAGQRHVVFRDERPAGTRSPIHLHPYGGVTCMVSGEMTLYLEGSEPQRAGPGQCYSMPPGRPMTGVNTGDGVAILFDIFTVPEGEAVWKVVEEGQQDLQESFG
ncbi:MAG: cupin domain-containing protein [Actinobacteria bacterium]|nr:cupin domain-containing protein [Actinomycetota bacterium]